MWVNFFCTCLKYKIIFIRLNVLEKWFYDNKHEFELRVTVSSEKICENRFYWFRRLINANFGHFEYLVWLEISFRALSSGIVNMVLEFYTHKTQFQNPVFRFKNTGGLNLKIVFSLKMTEIRYGFRK